MTAPPHSCSLRLTERVALVTGASRGIGLAVARRVVAEGGRVVMTARGADALKEAADELGEAAVAVPGDAGDPDHAAEAVRAAVAHFGRLDVLVNNAGVNPSYGPLLMTDPAATRKIFDVNVLGTLAWTREAHRQWFGRSGGTVVNVGSIAGDRPATGLGAYGASKAALGHLTRQLASELAPKVRVNAVLPAVVRTQFAAPLFQGREDGVARGYPLRRIGTPEDVAGSVAFLASDDAAWMTGHLLVLDGGLTLGGGI